MIVTAEPTALPTMVSIAAETAAMHGLTLAELRGHTRIRELAKVRHEAMWRIRCVKRPDGKPRYTYPQIGMFFGGRYHTVVIRGCRRYETGWTWKGNR